MKNYVKFLALLLVAMFVLSFAVVAEPTADEPVAVEEVEEPIAVEEVPEDVAVEETAPEAEQGASNDYMYELLIDAKLNGSFDLTLIQPMKGEYADSIDSYLEAYQSNFGADGFAVEKNEAGDAIVITKTYEKTVPSISLPGDAVEAHQFAVDKGWFCDTYFLTDRTFDMTSYPAGENYFKIKVTTPLPAVFSNAMETENWGRTSVFGIKTGFANPITMIYKVYKPIPLACLAMLIILLVVFVIIVRSNRKKKFLEELDLLDFDDFIDDEDFLEYAEDEAEEIFEDAEETVEETVEEVTEEIEEVTEEVTEETEDEDK